MKPFRFVFFFAACPIFWLLTFYIQRHYSLLFLAIWGALLLLSMYGLGAFLVHFLIEKPSVDFGIKIATGFCAWIGLGGLLNSFGISGRNSYSFIVVLTTAWASAELWVTRHDFLVAQAHRTRRRLIAAAFIVMVPAFLGGMISRDFVPFDDYVSYFAFAREILARGTLSEPFGYRALASYGAQSVLHALLLVGARTTDLAFLEQGLLKVLAGIIWIGQWTTGSALTGFFGILTVLYVTYYPSPVGNSSIFSGVAAFSCLLLVMRMISSQPRRQMSNAALLGLAMSAACALRPTYAAPVFVWTVVFYGSRAHSENLRRLSTEWVAALIACVLFLIPWVYTYDKTFATPLYPLMAGNTNPEWTNLFTAHSLRDYAAFLWDVITSQKSEYRFILPFLAVAAGFIPRRSPSVLAKYLSGSTLCLLAVCGWKMTYFESHEFERYTIGFILPLLLWIVQSSVNEAVWSTVPRQRWVFPALLGGFMLLSIRSMFLCLEQCVELPYIVHKRIFNEFDRDGHIQMNYSRLQGIVPPGQRILAMVDETMMFDYARNPIDSLDLVGAVSPPPGIQNMTSSRQIVSYFQKLGYEWLVMTNPDETKGLYSLKSWKRKGRIKWEPAKVRPEIAAVWQIIGQSMVQVIEKVNDISHICPPVYERGGLLLIDLRQCHLREEESIGGGGASVRRFNSR